MIKHLVVIAGEESGDQHAAAFIRSLKTQYPKLHVSGIGGRHMQKAGAVLVSDLARFGVTGLSEVLTHFLVIRRAFKRIKAHLMANKPDLLVLVDYPGFNLRLARFAKRVLGLRIIYYISPQIWAWKANRINTIRAYVDHMAVILPFEKTLYTNAGVPVSFVGHPLLETMRPCGNAQSIRAALKLPNHKRIVAFLPGSRNHEIERHMPVFRDTMSILCQKVTDLQFVIPIAGTINPSRIQSYFSNTKLPCTFVEGHAIEVAACSDCIVVASGTASLECALQIKPMCIVYKASWLTYWAAMRVMKVNYLGLCNLLEQKMIVPELLQHDCNATELSRVILDLLNNESTRQRMQSDLTHMKQSLSLSDADCTIVDLILEFGQATCKNTHVACPNS